MWNLWDSSLIWFNLFFIITWQYTILSIIMILLVTIDITIIYQFCIFIIKTPIFYYWILYFNSGITLTSSQTAKCSIVWTVCILYSLQLHHNSSMECMTWQLYCRTTVYPHRASHQLCMCIGWCLIDVLGLLNLEIQLELEYHLIGLAIFGYVMRFGWGLVLSAMWVA